MSSSPNNTYNMTSSPNNIFNTTSSPNYNFNMFPSLNNTYNMTSGLNNTFQSFNESLAGFYGDNVLLRTTFLSFSFVLLVLSVAMIAGVVWYGRFVATKANVDKRSLIDKVKWGEDQVHNYRADPNKMF